MTQNTAFEIQLFVSAPLKIRPYYKRDVLNLCCLPVADHIDLAFKHKWLSSTVLEHVEKNADVMRGWTVAIVFCEPTGQTDGDVYRFHPIRRAHIVSVTSAEAVATFHLKLGAFISVREQDLRAAHELIGAQGAEHPNHRRPKPGEDATLAKFVRCAPASSQMALTTDSWDSFVMRMISLNAINDSLFFALSDDDVNDYPRYPFREIARGYRNRREAKLIRGTEVQLNIYAISGTNREFLPPTARAPDSVVRINGPYVRQRRNGFALYFGLQIKPGWDRDNATMTFVFAPPTSNSSSGSVEFFGPEISVHVRAIPRGGMTLLVLGALILGAGMSSLDGDTVAAMGLARETALIGKAIGPILLGIGVFFGFRKLPKL